MGHLWFDHVCRLVVINGKFKVTPFERRIAL